jgi:hypothetical protein
MGEICEYHGELLTGLGDMREQIGEIREAVRTLKEIARANRDAIGQLEQVALDNAQSIQRLTAIVTNGLSSKVDKIHAVVERREVERTTGITGWLADTWKTTSRQLGFAIFLLLAWLLLWGAVKSGIFKEPPYGLMGGNQQSQKHLQHQEEEHRHDR